MINLEELFDKFEAEGEHGKLDRVFSPPSIRPDLCAFLIVNSLVPGQGDIVSATEHDKIWLSVDPAELAKVATEEIVRDLVRCGVCCDGDGLYMLV